MKRHRGFTLIELLVVIIKGAANLMLMREMWRLTFASLRPANGCTNSSSSPPVDPFLIARDTVTGVNFSKGEYVLRANGSRVLFADGHVKLFDMGSFSTNPPTYTTPARTYDSNTQQWYNYYFTNPSTPQQKALNMQIAISP